MEVIKTVNTIIAVVFFVCYAYQYCYLIIPFFKKTRHRNEPKLHNYAVLISARNEENVIGQLISSVQGQSYPSERIKIFVVADNCTDNTADVARAAGATVYERFNTSLVGKGYAVNFLIDQLGYDYPEDSFDGYFIFDADNVLDADYITEMNKTFSDGYEIVTSYRNSKNYGDNWISAGYSLWFLREAKYLNYSRMQLGTSCAVSGTGFMFSRRILEKTGGWKFFLLTEDIEFTISNVLGGEVIGYCHEAVLYDEQPVKFSQSWTQRMRWAKGYLQVFRKFGKSLISGVFKKRGFACFDMSMVIMPAIVLAVVGVIANLSAAVINIYLGKSIIIIVGAALGWLVNVYITLFIVGAIATLSEWKMIHCSPVRKIVYMFTFPLFMITYIPISFVAIFKKVEWVPIKHHLSVSVQDIKVKQ